MFIPAWAFLVGGILVAFHTSNREHDLEQTIGKLIQVAIIMIVGAVVCLNIYKWTML